MSDENLLDEGGDDFATKSSGPSAVMLLVVAALGAGAGGWFGGPIVTPMVADIMASEPSDGDGHGARPYGDASADDGPLAIDNLILNPAESGGSRFLIATLVLDTDDETRAELESRDAEARDLLQTVLAVRTVAELSDISLRDEIRSDLRIALNTMLGYEGVHRIFLPQFVIQ
ncbi:MAG: flagellar basal body-associated FliL family protein [Gemmatimonadetes bacterium]|nr:flagellar basal body-associated FliL family protein [Gemmatimonadota bacterium]